MFSRCVLRALVAGEGGGKGLWERGRFLRAYKHSLRDSVDAAMFSVRKKKYSNLMRVQCKECMNFYPFPF